MGADVGSVSCPGGGAGPGAGGAAGLRSSVGAMVGRADGVAVGAADGLPVGCGVGLALVVGGGRGRKVHAPVHAAVAHPARKLAVLRGRGGRWRDVDDATCRLMQGLVFAFNRSSVRPFVRPSA